MHEQNGKKFNKEIETTKKKHQTKYDWRIQERIELKLNSKADLTTQWPSGQDISNYPVREIKNE